MMASTYSPSRADSTMSSARARILGLIFIAIAGGAAAGDGPALDAFYFPRKDHCTVMVDYEKVSDRLRQLARESRNLEIVRGMLREWEINGSAKCKDATNVSMLAVIIPGKDEYGRPDFSNRKNLLKLDSDTGKLLEMVRRKGQLTMEFVKRSGKLELYP